MSFRETVSTIRPGLLVSLKTSTRGNVHYTRQDLDTDQVEGVAKARWETTRIITDAAEFDRACKVREQAGRLVRAICKQSAFGLLCPEADRDLLDKAVAEARALTDKFNDEATLTRVTVNVLVGRIASDDVEAVKAINGEVADLLAMMQDGLKNADIKAIREAASKAKALGNMVSPENEARIKIAIEAARSAANKISKAAEGAAAEIDQQAIRKVTEMRTAFLDLDDAAPVEPTKAKAAAVDMAPPADTLPSGAPKPARRRRVDVEG